MMMAKNSKEIKFICTDDDLEYSLIEFAEKHKEIVTPSQVRHRYYKLNRPKKASIAELTQYLPYGGQNSLEITVIMPDGSTDIMSMKELAAACNEIEGVESPVST